ncbi:hypothetical protein IBTHAUMO2_720020 [Nitrosopumilaceae archaeon]|nr:hypothetical protein IBTHAUMO2_720020 [Nitrosopumilaceae archaeon]
MQRIKPEAPPPPPVSEIVASVAIPSMVLTMIASILLIERIGRGHRIIRDFVPAWAVIPTMGVVIAVDYVYTGNFIP